MIFRYILLISLLHHVMSHKSFQKKIPNGEHVPFPCKLGQTWLGVGHFVDQGTGPRNPFGLDFYAAGLTWTVKLCRADSDGDGMTNGKELGDPDCVWTEGSNLTITKGLSHPGICDPWDSPACMQKKVTGGKYQTQGEWLTDMCKSDGLDCPALKDTDVKNLTVRISPGTRIPAKATTYECQIFDIYSLGVPRDQDFHVVAVTPIIDNRNVLHHMGILGCSDTTMPTSQPFECGMLASITCQDIIHIWTVGLDGECFHPQTGIRIGQTAHKIIAIQLHWNNPEKTAGMMDSSGLLVHYTPKLRAFDAGVLMIGSSFFQLPPRREELIIQSTCASECTKQFMNDSVNITSAWNHMHYAGRKMHIEIKRNNQHVIYLTDDKTYSYDSPQVHQYSTPFMLFPGDELLTTCGFSTSNRNTTTFFGEATQDEMCFGFITYYPKQNMTTQDCTDQLDISTCNPQSFGECTNLDNFMTQFNTTSVFIDVTKNCRSFTPCAEECLATILDHMKTEPCMKGKIWEYAQTMLTMHPYGWDFLSRLASCKVEVFLTMNPPPQTSTEGTDSGTTITTTSAVGLMITAVLIQILI